MTWQILSHGFILNQSQPLTGYSPFQREMERIQIQALVTKEMRLTKALIVGTFALFLGTQTS